MGAPRRKNLIASRRRTDDDGEDEGSVAMGIEDDSSSQGSVPSDLDEDADAEGSDASEIVTPGRTGAKKGNGQEGPAQSNGKPTEPVVATDPTTFSTTITDTEVMLNGMNLSNDTDAAAELHFDDAQEQADALEAISGERNGKVESLIERKRREHEEYKKKRDADPAFVPNRGGFFMHDHRVAMPGQNGFRPSGRGRGGRGRGGMAGPFSPISHTHTSSNPADAPWAHDLHETVVNEAAGRNEPTKSNVPVSQPPRAMVAPQRTPPPNRSFSRTTHVGNVQLRVFIAGMGKPVIIPAVPVNQHTRLPHHRPPLRRDKPVRISLPNCAPRYIFPAIDRSFIFIPRALRPNQQSFNRGRGARGSFGTYGGYPSGRTSAYGGSVYSPSIAMSRRSSMAREMGRDGLVSPAVSVMSRNRSTVMDAAGKPVVRLPPAGELAAVQAAMQHASFAAPPAPVVNLPMPQVYPQPQNPLSHETLPLTLPMHQPRPQKAVSVAGIESPAGLNFHPPQQQVQQPFHQQVPVSVNQQAYNGDPNMYLHSRRPSHPSQRGTPLSQIPERAIHAQPFQPYPFQQAQGYYPHPQQYAAPVYYYPPPGANMAPSMAAPAFVPGQQYQYMVPAPAPAAPAEPSSQGGTVAHESNGMVYYYDSSQLPPAPPAADDPSAFQPMAYAPPNGYMMAQPQVYYPPQ